MKKLFIIHRIKKLPKLGIFIGAFGYSNAEFKDTYIPVKQLIKYGIPKRNQMTKKLLKRAEKRGLSGHVLVVDIDKHYRDGIRAISQAAKYVLENDGVITFNENFWQGVKLSYFFRGAALDKLNF